MSPKIEYYIGIDLSLRGTGITVLENSWTVEGYVQLLPELKIYDQILVKTDVKDRIEERYLQVIDKLKFVKNIMHCKGIYIEGLSYGSRGMRMLELAGLHYIIRTYLHRRNTEFTIVPPATLKKWTTGSGRADKKLMMETALERWGEKFKNDNLCDSYCLARMAYEEEEK